MIELERLSDIDRVEDSFRVDYFGGDLGVQFEYLDSNGGKHEAWITASAIRDLNEKLFQGQMAIMENTVNPDKGIGLSLILGPTRGECYFNGQEGA